MFVLLQIHAPCCAAVTACMRKEGACAWKGGRGQSATWRKVSASIPPAPTTAPASRASAYAVRPTRVLIVNKVRTVVYTAKKKKKGSTCTQMTLLFLLKARIEFNTTLINIFILSKDQMTLCDTKGIPQTDGP